MSKIAEVDGEVQELTITRHEKLCLSPAYAMAQAEAIELHRKYGAYPAAPYDSPCIVGCIGDVAVAVICYSKQDWQQSLRVELGAVHPEHRRKGYYRQVFLELCKVCEETHYRFIRSFYHVANDSSAAMHRALGRKIESHTTVYEVGAAVRAEQT